MLDLLGRSLVTPGALVTARQSAPIALIQDYQEVYVDLTQSAGQLLALRRAESAGRLTRASTSLPVTLTLEDGSTYGHEGKLEFTEVTVDAGTGAVTVRARFPNPEGLLLPGTYARARISTATVANALLVPQTAVGRTPSGAATLTLVNDKAEIEVRPVELGAAHGTNWIVASGLHPHERVVVEGLAKLRPGLPVKPVPAGSTASAPTAPSQH
jgi:membrane fusion protein (multidrug efflux system)